MTVVQLLPGRVHCSATQKPDPSHAGSVKGAAARPVHGQPSPAGAQKDSSAAPVGDLSAAARRRALAHFANALDLPPIEAIRQYGTTREAIFVLHLVDGRRTNLGQADALLDWDLLARILLVTLGIRTRRLDADAYWDAVALIAPHFDIETDADLDAEAVMVEAHQGGA